MKNCNLLRYVLALLVTFTASVSLNFSAVKAADAMWSALPMPQPTGTVVDMAISPNHDGVEHLLAFDNGFKLWRTSNDGGNWQNIYPAGGSTLSTIDRFTVADNGTLFIAGNTAAGPACLKSTDQGQTFTQFLLPVSIDSTAGFAAFNDQLFFFTSFDGSRSRVWRTTNGTAFESAVISAAPLSVLELSPGFVSDNNILAAGADGNVFMSIDGGATFTALQQSPLSGEISLTFAADYSSSRYIYAASTVAGSGIWRMKIGEPAWTRIDTGLANTTRISGIAVSANGVIYAAASNQVDSSSGGLIKKTPFNQSWETERQGLQAGTTLWGLCLRGNRVYSLDTTNNRIVTFNDTLASPVELLSPQSGAPGIGTFASGTVNGIDIFWRNPGGASGFQWQVSEAFDMSVVRFEGMSITENARLKTLDPGATYFWRVRATSPSTGPWSEVRSFTTALGAPVLMTPAIGATVQILVPPFQWQPSVGAKSYELMLSTSADFQVLAAAPNNINGNAWQPTAGLLPSTGYFWKVRAVGINTFSQWSAVSAFTTSTPPTTTMPPTTTIPTPPTTTLPTSQPPAATIPSPDTTNQTQTAQVIATAGAIDSSIPGLLIAILVGMACLSGVIVSLIFTTRRSKRG
jgi:hypothetical protein